MMGLGYIAVTKLNIWHEEQNLESVGNAWFAAYVDVTSTPTYGFEQLGSTETPNVVLSFIVSAPTDPCTPTWGGFYTMDQAGETLDLDRRIARLRQQGGQVIVSFGGALNGELALNCSDKEKLLLAYESVVTRYEVDTIDLDLENKNLSDREATMRRAEVIAELQTKRRSAGKNLAVWLTLPVAPQGMTEVGTNTIAEMLRNQVDLAGVNVMTMDYGGSKEREQAMHDASADALIQTHRQLGILYKQAGIDLSSATLWRKIGATPMIGQNDVVNEVFSTEDAVVFNKFAVERGVGRMSFWSANRDIPCGENYVDLKIVSDSCSGVKSEKSSFARILSSRFDGTISDNAQKVTVEDEQTGAQLVDDPDQSPYQIWNEFGTYLEKTKVVWHGNVYEAKWWTKGDMPDNPVLQSWETPWQLIGPVLPGEKPIPQPTLPPGTYPEWSGKIEYQAGQRVLFEGKPYLAKWWNVGESPAASSSNVDTSAWMALSQKEIEEIIGRMKLDK
jgi:chitinase